MMPLLLFIAAVCGCAVALNEKNHLVHLHEVAKVQGGTHPEGCVVRGRERGARPPHKNKIGRFPYGFKNSSSLFGKFLINATFT